MPCFISLTRLNGFGTETTCWKTTYNHSVSLTWQPGSHEAFCGVSRHNSCTGRTKRQPPVGRCPVLPHPPPPTSSPGLALLPNMYRSKRGLSTCRTGKTGEKASEKAGYSDANNVTVLSLSLFLSLLSLSLVILENWLHPSLVIQTDSMYLTWCSAKTRHLSCPCSNPEERTLSFLPQSVYDVQGRSATGPV